jgi:hypothetical protein
MIKFKAGLKNNNMEDNKILLLSQLMNGLIEGFNNFEKSYSEQDKVTFESSKKAILETQGKINFILKEE